MDPRLKLLLVLAVCFALAAPSAHAQQWDLSQYANIAPLPGAGVAIDTNGRIDGRGAMQINIPVAYTPNWGYVAGSAYGGAHVRGQVDEFGNGSGFFAMGFFNRPGIYMSGMKTSHVSGESLAWSGQGGLTSEAKNFVAIAIGQQDILGKEVGGVSPYAVATKSVLIGARTYYFTLGYGGGRFLDNLFGGLSTPLTDKLNLAVENDGYQANIGLGWRPGGRDGKMTVLGAYNGKCGFLLGFSVSGSFAR